MIKARSELNFMTTDIPLPHWEEDTSQNYLDYGKYLVPARQQQMVMMLELLKSAPQPAQVLELCCGEGLLAEQILESLPDSRYWGLDGSRLMLECATQRLSRFGARVRLDYFELAGQSWRNPEPLQSAVVSSLAIHHLDGTGKKLLFANVYAMLAKGGVFIISDMIEPTTDPGRQVAADAWDQVVRERSLELDGNTRGLDFFLREHWNTFRYPDPDDIDHPSPLFDQLKWLEGAGFIDIDVHFLHAGHALFSGWKVGD
jgi:tRNA (cmo5U34)-methyltransferase